MNEFSISRQTLKRLPGYLNYLHKIADKDSYISAASIASALKLNCVQVRKDLASVSSSGRPKLGYPIRSLIEQLESFLGYHNIDSAVIVGAGHLGRALLNYGGFKAYGLKILAAFDADEETVNTDGRGSIFHISRMKNLCERLHPKIGIITVPAEAAQSVCDMLVECGVEAIWNFAPTHLNVKDDILVVNENMAVHLALISTHLRCRSNNRNTESLNIYTIPETEINK